ncbi:MAG: HIT domain-containing protein, partial [Candidatus Marinimicrobia bacterium]|nr:HIT domain-containing protein [Candidatus Neomarinimicrobiota bacterium]
MSNTIFARIINKEIPADIIHEDDQCVAFRDANPQAPVHFLVVPRKPIPRLQDLVPEDSELIGHIHQGITRLAASEGIADGYR